MPVFHQAGGVGIYRVLILPSEWPNLLCAHRAKDPGTQDLEAEARALVAGDFQLQASRGFVKHVCSWGGYDGVSGRVLKGNAPDDIAAALREAHRLCAEDKPVDGLRRIITLKGLCVSFGSKHAKFLDPERSVVLDSIISTQFGYPLSAIRYPLTLCRYAEFLADCHALLDIVRAAGVPYPFLHEGTWRVSDIEMCLFQSVRP